MIPEVLFPIVTGAVVQGLKAGLTARAESYTEDVQVRPELPPKGRRTERMVIVRDDGGPQVGFVQQHGFGFNAYAEDADTAEKIARMCMALLPTLANGSPIVRVGNLSGPFRIRDESTEKVIVGDVTLAQFYFTAQVWSRGADL
jgi:hypothetical protein